MLRGLCLSLCTAFLAIYVSHCSSPTGTSVVTPGNRIIWTKCAADPVVKKANLITEFYAIGQPTCLFENDTFKMWYVAGGLPYIASRLLYAWSMDGITWTKYGSGASVMDPGGTGSWDVCIDTPEILHDATGYKLYFLGDTMPGGSNFKPSFRFEFHHYHRNSTY